MCQGSDFTQLLQRLGTANDGICYIAPFLPGHGETVTSLCQPPTVHGFVELILDFLRDLGMEEVILLGHSMSSRIVLQTWSQAQAAQHTGAEASPLIKGIILLDGSHAKLRSSNRFEKMDRKGATGLQDIFAEMVGPKTPESFKEEMHAHTRSRDKAYCTALRNSYNTWDHELCDDVVTEVGRTGIPVLQIQSTDVDLMNRRNRLKHDDVTVYMTFVKERVPEVRQIVIEEAGHFPHVDQVGAVAQGVRTFIEEVFGVP